MENFIIVDAVLQATHMRKFQKQSMHIKKYHPTKSHKYLSKPNLLINYSPKQHSPVSQVKNNSPSRDKKNLSSRKFVQNRTKDEFSPDVAKEKKLEDKQNVLKSKFLLNSENRNKIKTILKENQKQYTHVCCKLPKKTLINLNQFFSKRQIQPKTKTSRQCSSARALTSNRKNRNIQSTAFYDYDINFIKQRHKNCLILSEPVKANEKEEKIFKEKSMNVREIIKKQIEEQKRKRKVECKTASTFVRHKASIVKQTKKIEQQLRIREIEDHNKPSNQQAYNYKHSTGLEIHKGIMPFSKEELKTQSLFIMDKYKIDMSKYFFKLHGQ